VARAVRLDRYGGREVLYIAEVEVPSPESGEVLVEVRAAGTNPGEAAIREGLMDSMFPPAFPSGQGSDLAVVVRQVGDDVEEFGHGGEVLGWSFSRSSQADFVVAVSGAAGGVGSVAVQLLKLKGAKVIGIASESNHAWLASVDVTPVAYGTGLVDRIRAIAPSGVDAFIDTHGGHLCASGRSARSKARPHRHDHRLRAGEAVRRQD